MGDRPSGVVHQVNRKPETPGERGLPKRAADEVELSPAGVVGDFNRWRHEVRKDDPDQAVLLLPLETVEELAREGWPVRPGDLGENVTTEGVPYGAFQPATRWRVGGATLEITRPCEPCDFLYQLPYVGTPRGPEFLKVTLGRRGWYARVLTPGKVRPGDPVAELP